MTDLGPRVVVAIGRGDITNIELSSAEITKRQEAEAAFEAARSADDERKALLAQVESTQATEVLESDPDVVRLLRLESARRSLQRGQMPERQLLTMLGL